MGRQVVASGYPMTASNAHDPPGDESLKDVRILLVEDAWNLAKALKNLLQCLGANVAGPAATVAEAERLISEHTLDLALVDLSLRGGEQAYGLIDRLHGQGIPVIVTTGYSVPLAPGKAAAILQKPVSTAQILAAVRTVTSQNGTQ
jgi:DNA-binding NtrC family response regulator